MKTTSDRESGETMTLGPVMLDIEGTELTPADRALLRHRSVGGVIVFSRNFDTPEQLHALSQEIRALRSPELLLAVDQEGGRVQRLRNGLTDLPPMRLLGRGFAEDRRKALATSRKTGWLLGSEVAAVGLDFSFAPVLDLDWGVSEIIGDRAFHREPGVVAELGLQFMRGLRDAGVAAIAKHFPGHGAVVADSHLELPTDRRELADIAEDIRPYERLIRDGLSGIMSAHVVYERCDAAVATFSRWWLTDYLRGQLNFGGAIFSDDLSMRATRKFGTLAETARLALSAGCDMVLVCNNRRGAERVAEALGDWRHPPSMARLASLRGKSAATLSVLQVADEWQEARAEIGELFDPPQLKLDA